MMKIIFFKKNNFKQGYILIFTLIISSITLLISIPISNILLKELYFSRLIYESKKAYFAAAAGLECAHYFDSVFKNNTNGISIILNATSTTGSGYNNFENNLLNKVFKIEIGNDIVTRTGISGSTAADIIDKIFCASDGSYNKVFSTSITRTHGGYASTSVEVLENLNNRKTSYTIYGEANFAITRFGLIIGDPSSATSSCAYVEYYKMKGIDDFTSSWRITSVGYSNCDPNDKHRVSRTILRFSN